MRKFTSISSVILLIGSVPVAAWAAPAALSDCSGILDDRQRLTCYDQLAGVQRRDTVGSLADDGGGADNLLEDTQPAQAGASASRADKSFLGEYWELGREYQRGVFDFRPHEPNYLLATYTASPNSAPYLPFRGLEPGAGRLSHFELAFQLSFKMKFAEDPLHMPGDLWFAYTQRSFWQAGNREASSPFRETNYQPEVMAVFPVRFSLLGLRARFVNLGAVHHSNGQGSTLSRSWNRVYAQLGLERGGFTVLARVWQRLNEDPAEDDNPDIVDYMGRGDLNATYRWQGHEFSLLARYNFQTDKGAAQIGWAFPIEERLKGYVQVFSGYGQSLIDYNHEHNALGVGVILSY